MSPPDRIRLPAEWEAHACCWMSWAVGSQWGKAANKVKRELSNVVQAVARYEPVRLLAPRGPQLREARREFLACPNVEVIEAAVDDIWLRDIAPTFATRGVGGSRNVVAIDWNFNGWGGSENVLASGECPADIVAAVAGVPCLRAAFVAEGGALLTDGCGTAVATRSCLLNPNRNPVIPGMDRQRMIEDDLRQFGIGSVIWLEGDPCESVTSGHADGYVLIAPMGNILAESCDDEGMEAPMWREHDAELLRQACDRTGRPFKVVRIAAPRYRYWKKKSASFAAAYLNVYIANGAVIGASFGDVERDEAAKAELGRAFPDREIVMLNIDHLAEGGGGIHCLTQPMPLV